MKCKRVSTTLRTHGALAANTGCLKKVGQVRNGRFLSDIYGYYLDAFLKMAHLETAGFPAWYQVKAMAKIRNNETVVEMLKNYKI